MNASSRLALMAALTMPFTSGMAGALANDFISRGPKGNRFPATEEYEKEEYQDMKADWVVLFRLRCDRYHGNKGMDKVSYSNLTFPELKAKLAEDYPEGYTGFRVKKWKMLPIAEAQMPLEFAYDEEAVEGINK